MDTHYKCRIDTQDEKLISRITKGCKKYAFCWEVNEDGGNPHTHLYIATAINNGTLRKRIVDSAQYKNSRKAFEEIQITFPEVERKKWSGNCFYSLRELSEDEEDPASCPYLKYLAYMAKQNDIHFHGFSDSALSEMKLQIVERNKAVKAEILDRKRKRRTVLQQMEDVFCYDKNPPQDSAQVVTDVITWYKTQEKLVRKFQMVSQSQTLCLKYIPTYQYTLLHSILTDVDKPLLREWYDSHMSPTEQLPPTVRTITDSHNSQDQPIWNSYLRKK